LTKAMIAVMRCLTSFLASVCYRDSDFPWHTLFNILIKIDQVLGTGGSRSLIHRSAWKENSPKLSFRLTEFLRSSHKASEDGIMLVVKREDPPGETGVQLG